MLTNTSFPMNKKGSTKQLHESDLLPSTNQDVVTRVPTTLWGFIPPEVLLYHQGSKYTHRRVNKKPNILMDRV